MAQKIPVDKKKVEEIIQEIDKKTGSDKTTEILHANLVSQKIQKFQNDQIIVFLKDLATSQTISKESLLALIEIVKNLKQELPPYFDVKLLNQKFPDKIKITNLDAIKFPDGFELKQSEYLETLLINTYKNISKVIAKQVQNVNLTGPSDPRKPIAVRLSDGKSFYTALNQIVYGNTATGDTTIIAEFDELEALLGTTIINTFGEISVIPATETVLASYTVPLTKILKLKGVFGEGNGDGVFRLYRNSNKIWQGRIAWTDRNIKCSLESDCLSGEIVELRVIHNRPVNHDFSGGFYGYRI